MIQFRQKLSLSHVVSNIDMEFLDNARRARSYTHFRAHARLNDACGNDCRADVSARDHDLLEVVFTRVLPCNEPAIEISDDCTARDYQQQNP